MAKPKARTEKPPKEKELTNEKLAALRKSIQRTKRQADRAYETYDYQKAVRLYSRALERLEEMDTTDPEAIRDSQILKYNLLSGRAACYKRQSDNNRQASDLEAMVRVAVSLDDIGLKVKAN
ncbi:MAG TPA: hypothetical protein VJ768_07660, partial [Anaerolineales bacterium]|nr:hypothetical protein [Anaerolineales bacterium]